MNDEIKKKIEEILYKADAFNFAETSEKLTTLYTEMVEGELRGFVDYLCRVEAKDAIINDESEVYITGMRTYLPVLEQYLSQTNKQEETK